MLVICMRILVVEDEIKLADAIVKRLIDEKYIVDVCYDGKTGLEYALLDEYDLILLDVMLPYVDGFQILKQLRINKVDTKIIILSAKAMINDKLLGLQNGANDYITKPFHMDELIARVNVQLRSNYKDLKSVISVHDLELNIKNSTLTCVNNGESIEIVGKEFLILQYLMENYKQIVSKDMMYDRIWGLDNDIESNNLEVYLSFIRKKLRMIESKVNIKALRNIGYKLEVKNEEIK